MIRTNLLFVLTLFTIGLQGQLNLRYEDGYSLNHEECITAFQNLADAYGKCELELSGPSDCGRPIHVFKVGSMSPELPTILINNAIHPGESCGVEASLILLEQLLKQDSPVLDKINIAVIPMYNVGGALNRSCCTRANQRGPTEQGFRGNSQHLDLNRDFIKQDSKNARTFQELFQSLSPALFVDTHTSNGADYSYTMTLIHSQLDMISPHLASVYRETLLPHLYERMEDHYPMAPYMDLIGETPEEGILDFPDWARYSTGYAGLWNCFGFTTEAHMLKPFSERVKATYHFLDELVVYAAEHSQEIHRNKQRADMETLRLDKMYLDYVLDTTVVDSFYFHGFEAVHEMSAVTGLPRLRYDRTKEWEGPIKHLRTYQGTDQIDIPAHYYVPQSWDEVISRLAINGVQMTRVAEDSLIQVEAYYIEDMRTGDEPYEGHYLHMDVKTKTETVEVLLYAGDYIIPTLQPAKRYIVNVLEPRAKDSFFAWGFFDAVMQQKEWFSPYVFEDMAEEILKNDPELNAAFQEKRKDEAFATDMWAQLIYVYRNSDYYEEEHRRYPVYRSLN